MIISKEFYRPYSFFRQLLLRGPYAFFKGFKEESKGFEAGPSSYPILIDKGSRCTCCGVCPEVCPTKCLKVEGGNKPEKFDFMDVHCIQCGVCVEICPENALEWTKVEDIPSEASWRSLLD